MSRTPRCRSSWCRNFFLAAVVASAAPGCVVGEQLELEGEPAPVPESDDPPDCEGAPSIDLALLNGCCEEFSGDAHCVPGSYVPGGVRDLLGRCDNLGYCVPDKLILSGGSVDPVECLSINGAGVCQSSCIPQVQESYDLLTQDICDVTERCVPCVNPLDGLPTGACDLELSCAGDSGAGQCPDGPHEGAALIDPERLAPCSECAAGGAHCMPSDLIAPDLGGRLAACESDPNTKCVPDEFIASAGAFAAELCASVGGGEGRCLSRCLPEVIAEAARLPQSSCAATHLCVPCTDPLNGEETGACGISCDLGPTEPPLVFPKCCDGRGTCIPPENAGEDAANLGVDTCPEESGLLCAPDEFIDDTFVASPCSTTPLFGGGEPGACLPDCLGAVDTIFVGRGTCSDGFKCAPCNGPFGGDTGACDFLP